MKMSRPVGLAGCRAHKPGEFDRGVEGQTHRPFDEAEDEQRQADDADECLDAAIVLQEHGGNGDRPFEVGVAPFRRLLAFVVAKHVAGAHLGSEVGEQCVPSNG